MELEENEKNFDLLDNVVNSHENAIFKRRRMSVCQLKQIKSRNKGNLNEYQKLRYTEKHNLTIPQLWQTLAKRTLMLIDPFGKFNLTQLPSEKVKRYQYNSLNKTWATDEVYVKIEGKSFNSGAMRECFRVKKISSIQSGSVSATDWKYASNYVAKKYMESVDDHVYYEDVRLQMDAKLWAEEFNCQIGVKRKVDIMKMSVIEFTERPGNPLYHLEHFIDGTYIKYNSNSGFVDEKTRNTPQAFSHFTFERSGHELIVVDVQGVGDLYTDPQIHTASQAGYGDGNLGCRGMALFFRSHFCNHVCDSLGLAKFDMAPSEIVKSHNAIIVSETIGKSRNTAPLKSLRISRPSTGRESALINILDGNSEIKEECPRTPDSLSSSGPINIKMLSPDSGFGLEEEDEEMEGKNEDKCELEHVKRINFHFDSNESDNKNVNDNDSIGSYDTQKMQNMHRPSCVAYAIQCTDDKGESILGMIHHEIALMHESGRFINKENPNDEIDWKAILFHEDLAAQLNNFDSVVNIAHYYMDFPDQQLLGNCPMKPKPEDRNRGWIYLTKAANNNHLPSIMAMANASDVGGIDNEPDWPTVVHWLEEALRYLEGEDSIEVTSYQLKARLGSMFRTSGYGLDKDLQRAMDLYSEAADEATAAMKGRLANKYYEIVEEISCEMENDEEIE